MKTKNRPITIFKTVLTLFVAFGMTHVAGAQVPVRHSYDSNPYTADPTNSDNWKWTGGTQRTIYNPLDGGVLLKYTMDSQGDSDGCSAGAPREKQLYQQACFAHDTNYDAPFPLAGFPHYPDGGSTGQDISDFLLFKDMQLINNDQSSQNDGLTNFVNDSAANSFYAAVTVGGTFRGASAGKAILAKGGVIAVVNKGAYLMKLTVTWNGPDGTARTFETTKPVGWAAVCPLSVGDTNIHATCDAVAGNNIFTKDFSGPGMYAYTVHGTTLSTNVSDGLENTLQTHTDPNAIKYSFQVKTADVYGAGTDSNIYFKIIGDKGSTTEEVSNPQISGNAFERNQTDTFTLPDDTDVGKITAIEVRSDMKYAGAAWNLEWVTIQKAGDPSSYVFQVHSWINDKTAHNLPVSEVRGQAAAAPSPVNYTFQVKTADVSGAGTDSNIFFTIHGDKGATIEQVSNPKISGNAFERNQTDSFTLTDADVGTISTLDVRSDTKYSGSDWNLEWIIVQKAGDSKSYVFQIHSWINDTTTHSFPVSEVRN